MGAMSMPELWVFAIYASLLFLCVTAFFLLLHPFLDRVVSDPQEDRKDLF